MAKRELSSNLRNLKFMQRATQKQEKAKTVEEAKPEDKFPCSTISKKCIVIMEGNPHPGALKGRMSFQKFNPSIDKLNGEGENPCVEKMSASSTGQDMSTSSSCVNDFSPNVSSRMETDSDLSRVGNNSEVEHKRKQPEVEAEAHTPSKTQACTSHKGDKRSSSKQGFHLQHKRERLDWSVLRPPKPQTKRG